MPREAELFQKKAVCLVFILPVFRLSILGSKSKNWNRQGIQVSFVHLEIVVGIDVVPMMYVTFCLASQLLIVCHPQGDSHIA